MHLLDKCSELMCFWVMLAQFGPSGGHKMTENCDFWPLSEKVFRQSNSNLWYIFFGQCSELVHFGPRWPNFGPLVATKWLKMVVSDHYLKKYSHNPIQTWCVHLLGECSELIYFWPTLALKWPHNEWKWWFLTIIWKSIHAIRFKLGVYT